MKWETRYNFNVACGLRRRELWNLLVKDIRWKDARLYVFVRKILIGDSLVVDERLIPVVPGQEHAILYLSVIQMSGCLLAFIYRCIVPCIHCVDITHRPFTASWHQAEHYQAPNKQHFTSPNDYDEVAAMEVARAMDCSHLDFDIVVRTYICGEIHRQHMDTEKKQKLIMEDVREDEKTSELL